MSKVAVPFNDLTRYARSLWERCANEVAQTMGSGRVILGPAVSDFERDFADYLSGEGNGYAVGVGNGTDALEISLRAVGVGAGSTVVTAANAGFYASAAIHLTGGSPQYVDVHSGTVCPSADMIESAVLSRQVSAVIITHLYGRLADDIEAIAALCAANGIPLIEDCSQSHGARSGKKMCGTFGDVAAFSFYPTKNLGALGDAGAVFTTSAQTAEVARSLRQYGWGAKYVVEHSGGRNSRLDELQAIVLRQALKDLDQRNEARRAIVDTYRAAAPHLDLQCVGSSRERWVGHLCVARFGDRDDVLTAMAEAGIACDVHFPVPDHQQPISRNSSEVSLPNTESLAAEVLSLPSFPEMTAAEVDHVAVTLSRIT